MTLRVSVAFPNWHRQIAGTIRTTAPELGKFTSISPESFRADLVVGIQDPDTKISTILLSTRFLFHVAPGPRISLRLCRERSIVVRSFTILTTTANRFMREIRDRMPVILDSSLVADWLDLEIQDRKDLEQIL